MKGKRKNCFFCDIQKETKDKKVIADNKYFFSRYDDFPVASGHCELVIKDHKPSFFDLTEEELSSFFELLNKTKKIIDRKFKPDGYNIGINEGLAAGRTQDHLHVHFIPRYFNDVKNPRGGVRNIISEKADYIPLAREMPSRRKYVE
jgi:diadenosine tetraphosphate (Ap4A) HIT family hydrolase